MVVILKLYWHKILAFFGIRKAHAGTDEGEVEEGTAVNSEQ